MASSHHTNTVEIIKHMCMHTNELKWTLKGDMILWRLFTLSALCLHYYQSRLTRVFIFYTYLFLQKFTFHFEMVPTTFVCSNQIYRWCGGATGRALDLPSTGRGFKPSSGQSCVTTLASYSHLCASVTKQYNLVPAIRPSATSQGAER